MLLYKTNPLYRDYENNLFWIISAPTQHFMCYSLLIIYYILAVVLFFSLALPLTVSQKAFRSQGTQINFI